MLDRPALRLTRIPRANLSRRLLSVHSRNNLSKPISQSLKQSQPQKPNQSIRKTASQRRLLTTSLRRHAIAPPTAHAQDPTPISTEEYHERSDEYLDSLLARLEEIAEKDERWDVEYSSGVLNAKVPDKGTYVLNKQPPNKQIWLSSPVSGPKRYDWVAVGDGVEPQEDKIDIAGDWVYLRTGETLSALLSEELGVDMTEALLD